MYTLYLKTTPLLRSKLLLLLISFLYLLIVNTFLGLKPEHWAIVILYNTCYWAGIKSRKIMLALSVFAIFGILYDFLKVYPNYLVNKVDISNIYFLEKKLFGIKSIGHAYTPNEFFAAHSNLFLDFLSGLFYINWMPVPIAFGIFLFFKNKRLFIEYSLCFLFVNIIGFIIYYVYPAAPPWYVAKYGFSLDLHVPGDVGGLERFDRIVNLPLFHSIYSRNSNVFAAMPSLHCAYPVIVLYFAKKNYAKFSLIFFVFFMIGIWFSAVYSGHHYVLDVIMGVLCAIIGILIFEKILLKLHFIKKFISKYEISIS